MLKKSLLETSPTKSKNEITAQTADNTNMTSMSNFEHNRLSNGGKESSQKLLSPSSQHDTTSDSLLTQDAAHRNTMSYSHKKKDLSELLVHNNLEASSLNERPSSNLT